MKDVIVYFATLWTLQYCIMELVFLEPFKNKYFNRVTNGSKHSFEWGKVIATYYSTRHVCRLENLVVVDCWHWHVS